MVMTRKGGLALCALLASVVLVADVLDVGYPESPIQHKGYALGYSSKHWQARWTQYRLTKENIKDSMGKPRYTGAFMQDPDPRIPYKPEIDKDYRASGYDRGHLVPDLDLRYSFEAQKETYYYSNVSPQKHYFNLGIWLRLENKVRSLAIREGSIVIVTGPIFPFRERRLGDLQTIPSKFFKVIYSEGETPKMIAFIIPHYETQAPLRTFVCTVAKVEVETGLKFFPKLPPDVQKDLKTRTSPADWGIE